MNPLRYASEIVIYKNGDSAPSGTSDIPATINDLWIDTTSGTAVLKVCTSITPYTWEAVNTVISITFSDPGSFQPIAPDLTLGAAAGDDKPDTAFLGAVMGNVFGTTLTKTGNYIGGVIGFYSVTGTGASTFPVGAVLAGIGDGSSDADGAVVAFIDGDSAQTNAGAAFKVMNNNSTPGSGFNYGLDLHDAARDGFSAVSYLVGDIRFADATVQRTASIPARSVSITIDGGASTPTTGIHTRWSVPTACTVTGWVLVADASGSAVIDVLRGAYSAFPTTASIAGTDKPTLSTVQKNENLGPLVNWGSTALLAGDIVEFNLASVTTCKVLSLTLNLTVP